MQRVLWKNTGIIHGEDKFIFSSQCIPKIVTFWVFTKGSGGGIMGMLRPAVSHAGYFYVKGRRIMLVWGAPFQTVHLITLAIAAALIVGVYFLLKYLPFVQMLPLSFLMH